LEEAVITIGNECIKHLELCGNQ